MSDEQIIGLLREADVGLPIKALCRKHGFSDASYSLWRSRFGAMTGSDAKRLNALESENARLKTLLAKPVPANAVISDAQRKNSWPTGPPAHRELVRQMIGQGLSERRSLTIVDMRARLSRQETPESQRTRRHARRCGNDLFDAATGGRSL